MTGNRVSWAECVVVGVAVFGVIGTGIVLAILTAFVAYIRTDQGLWDDKGYRVALSAAAGAAVSGVLAWRFVVRSREAGRWRGAAAGLVVGVLTHPVCWFVWAVTTLALDGAQPSGSNNPAALVFATVLLATLWSGLGLGWMTASLYASLGFLTADILSAVRRKNALRGPSPIARIPRPDDL